jgi:hypothetical protein
MPKPIAAIVYEEGRYPDGLFASVSAELENAGISLAGVIQRDEPMLVHSRCAMTLEELGSGQRIPISEYRGAGARGCRLDVSGLLVAAVAVSESLSRMPGLLVINKFGKIEAEGGGLRDTFVEAFNNGIPILIGVPARNLDSWRAFAGEHAVEFGPDGVGLADWIATHVGTTSKFPGASVPAHGSDVSCAD